MKTIILALPLISLVFFAQTAQAQHLTKLGERLSSCKNLENDDYLIEYENSLRPEVKSQWASDKLQTAIVKADNCFRVGTEIKLMVKNDDFPFLGRGLLEELKVVSRNQLASDPLNGFSSSSTQSFIAEKPARKYAVLRYKVTEKIAEAYTNEKYKRLPSCFPAYSDWEYANMSEDELNSIKSGQTKAQIWNGTFNCYKVGVFVEMFLQRDRREGSREDRPDPTHGYIVPNELFLVHYTNLTQKHADLLGESLNSLKNRMAEKKEVDGGWVTMVAFDYHAIHPKDLPQEDEEEK